MRVVITRARAQAEPLEKALLARGAEPVHFASIKISPLKNFDKLDTALAKLASFDWIIFTSSNAVEAVWQRLEPLGLALPAGPRVAAVGPKTAASLAQRGCQPDFIPQEYVAEAIVPGLGDLNAAQVLLPLADLAEDTLARAITAGGGRPSVVTAYHTLPAEPDPQGLQEIRRGVDAITFTSGSTARNFASLVSQAGLDPSRLPGSPAIACIGPKTAEAASQAGFQVHVVAETYTIDGLVAALMRFMATQQDHKSIQRPA